MKQVAVLGTVATMAAVMWMVFRVCGDHPVATSSGPTTAFACGDATLPVGIRERLRSADKDIRNKALIELSRHKRQHQAQPAPGEIAALLEAVLAVEDPVYVAQAAYIVSQFDRSQEAVVFANRVAEDGRSSAAVAGALLYLQRYDPEGFAQYFKAKKTYGDLPVAVREQLAATEAVSALRAEHCRQLVKSYLDWQPPIGSADFANPHREKVVAEGAIIVPALIAAHGEARSPSPVIVRALGEIGDPAAFRFLLDAYRKDQRQDIAVAVGSSWRSLSVDEAFKSLDESELKALLSVVLAEKWSSLSKKSRDEWRNYVVEQLVEIIKNCRERSKPILG